MKRLFIALLIFAGVATARAQSTPGYTLSVDLGGFRTSRVFDDSFRDFFVFGHHILLDILN